MKYKIRFMTDILLDIISFIAFLFTIAIIKNVNLSLFFEATLICFCIFLIVSTIIRFNKFWNWKIMVMDASLKK